MSLGNTGDGFNNAGAYQASAMPWVSGTIATSTTPQKIGFPKVTKYVKVRSGGVNRIGFTFNGVQGTNYFRMSSGTVETFDVRVKEMYIRADAGTGEVDIFAGLTLISDRETGFLTGSTAFSAQSPGSGWQGVG